MKLVFARLPNTKNLLFEPTKYYKYTWEPFPALTMYRRSSSSTKYAVKRSPEEEICTKKEAPEEEICIKNGLQKGKYVLKRSPEEELCTKYVLREVSQY